MLICSKCFNIICKCKNKRKFECDELMIPVIKTLNLKGYKTMFCCSGHMIDPKHANIQTYIVFEKPTKFNCKPKGFTIENISLIKNKKKYLRTVIEKINEPKHNTDYNNQLQIILKNINELSNWVNNLKGNICH